MSYLFVFKRSLLGGQNLLKPRPDWSPLGVKKTLSPAQMVSFSNNNNNNNLLLIRRKYLCEYIQMRLTSYNKIINQIGVKLGVKLKISDEHPRLFHMGVPPGR